MTENKQEPKIQKKSGDSNSVGIKAVLDRAMQAYEKLPMLEIVFERLIRSLTSSLRNLTSENVEISVTDLESLRFGMYLSNIEQPSSIAVFKAIEWDNLGLVILDNHIVLSLVDVLLGGKHGGETVPKRPLTYIEQTIAKQLVEIILSELGNAFDAISPSNFLFERLESNPNFATICRSGDAIISLKLMVQIEEQSSGSIDIVIPYNTIEPIKEQLQKVFIGDKFGIDSVWEELLTQRIQEVGMPLEAVVINTPTKIIDVAKLKPGDTIILNHKYDEDVTLRCKNLPIFKGQIGKVEDKVAINVTETIIGE
jgi:flagellar motor switch protein FliM